MLTDLNHLRALEALLRLRHVSRAAAAIGVSQPAMSRILAQLRADLGDPLLVRSRGDYLLTPRGEAIAADLAERLNGVAQLLAPTRFDPASASDRVRIGLLDYEGVVLLPAFLARLQALAPGVSVEVVGGDAANLRHVVDGRLDCSIQSPRTPPQGCLRSALFREKMLSLHPVELSPFDLDRFTAHPHVVIGTPDDDRSAIDLALDSVGRSRRVAARLPYFAAAHRVASEARLIFTAPARLIAAFPVPKGMAVSPPPTGTQEGFTISLYWHERRHSDPMHRWLRALLRIVARSLPEGRPDAGPDYNSQLSG
ncbi:MAG: LysR family transcriptional regulator [Elsteraceae bacterium]